MAEQHTPGAVRAAEALWDDEKRFGPHSNKANYVTKATTIINRETGLPELLEAAKKLLSCAPILWGKDEEKWPRLIDRFEKAIAKAEPS